jgi:hypothetical protein
LVVGGWQARLWGMGGLGIGVEAPHGVWARVGVAVWGRVWARRRVRVVGWCVGAVLLLGLLGCGLGVGVAWGAGCEGCVSWWRVDVGARPTFLRSGLARVEVQELLVSEAGGVGGGVQFRLRVGGEHGVFVGAAGEFFGSLKNDTYFSTEPFAAAEETVLLSAGNLQLGLEENDMYGRGYGRGRVLVEEVAVGADGVPLAAGEKRFLVRGSNARHMEKLEVPETEFGSAVAKVVTEGRPDGQLFVVASNVGDAAADGELVPVVIKDKLPAGVSAVEYEAVSGDASGSGVGPGGDGRVLCELETLPAEPDTTSCVFGGSEAGHAKLLPPFNQIEVRIGVDLSGAAHSGMVDRAFVSGGGAARGVSVARPLTVSGEPTPFGLENFEVVPEDADGTVDVQAGSHPFQTSFVVDLNQAEAFTGLTGEPEAEPAGLIKTFRSTLPPGMLGNPVPFPRCTIPEFQAETCPEGSIVGAAVARVNEPTEVGLKTLQVPVYNLEPNAGEPARLGFLPTRETPVFINTSVRNGGDYGVTAQTSNIVQVAGDLRALVTLWGVPGDPRHNSARGGCLDIGHGPCTSPEARNPPAFLVLPSSCSGHPLVSYAEADSWEAPGVFVHAQTGEGVFGAMPTLTGCNEVPFEPSIKLTPTTNAASSPLGLRVDVHVPQESLLNGKSLEQADIRNIRVTLPEGVVLNPAAGNGLQACSEGLVGFEGPRELDPVTEPGQDTLAFTGALEAFQPGVNSCATASKVGEVTFKTPVLANPLKGGVYLASQEANPFGSLVAMYLVAEERAAGVLVKLAGRVEISPAGQITTVFDDSPQTPVEDAELRFFGGERAALASPAHCGTYTTTSSFVPWSAEGFDETAVTAHPSSSFQVTSGPGGTPCPGSTLPAEASATGGTTGMQAGGFAPVTTSISRPSGSQTISQVQVTTPVGLSGILDGVELCPEAQANTGTCGPGSLIGESTVSAGVGGSPITVTGGKVYLTGPYQGAAFGLSITSPAKAGPYDLEDTQAHHPPCDCVVVRARLAVNPESATLTATTDSTGEYRIPESLEGIPLQIQHVNVTINRPHFTFNPANCDPLALEASILGGEGATQTLQTPFQSANCALLKFTPTVSVSAGGHASKKDGAGLKFKISYPTGAFGTQAWFASAKFDIPKQLPSRLETIQQACLANTFEHDRTACPAHSIIGTAIAHTQLLPVPLEGQIYFVSYGAAKFPDAVFVLHGYGITIEMHGHTFISKTTGVTSVTFPDTPQVPFENIEVTLPTGPYSEFGANLPHQSYDFCGRKLTLPNALDATNGLEIHQNTPVTITGCKKPKPKHHAKRAATSSRPARHAHHAGGAR